MATKSQGARPGSPQPPAREDEERVQFAVDTRLFRELGELLVGRESTALAELIKNAYDADATLVSIFATDLDDPAKGQIVVTDNGNGMDGGTFRKGFLTIASRSKVGGDRRSRRFHRRFTGEKGVGRLAAHKLARHLEVTSNYSNSLRFGQKAVPAEGALQASIDWDLVESAPTLDTIPSQAVTLRSAQPKRGASTGTTLSLGRLRSKWTTTMKARFVVECKSLRPAPELLRPLNTKHFADPGLFGDLALAGEVSSGAFDIALQGDFSDSEGLFTADPAKAILCIEIQADAKADRLTVQVTPSRDWVKLGMEVSKTKVTLSNFFRDVEREFGKVPKMSFVARIFETHGREWPRHASGVRVFMEGFRVLPYGEATDDWLKLKSDVTRRSGTLQGLVEDEEVAEDGIRPHDREGLSLKSDQAYMGAVLLTHAGVPNLQMLINREGFLPGAGIEALSRAVRHGIHLATRFRAAAIADVPRPRAEQARKFQAATVSAPTDSTPSARYLSDALREATRAAKALEKAQLSRDLRKSLTELKASVSAAADVVDEAFQEQVMLRVLASIGTQLSALSHEVSHLLPSAKLVHEGITVAIKELRQVSAVTPKLMRELRLVTLRQESENLLRALERQAVYLVDVSGTAARRRRSRQVLHDRFDQAIHILGGEIERFDTKVVNAIDASWKTQPMFTAEATMIFVNLLSNAIKAAGRRGRVWAHSIAGDGETAVRIENTGVKVDVRTSDKWFKPFRSGSTSVDATLGQGMGLGLTITRSMLDEYGAAISFVRPSQGYSTAIEIKFPTGK